MITSMLKINLSNILITKGINIPGEISDRVSQVQESTFKPVKDQFFSDPSTSRFPTKLKAQLLRASVHQLAQIKDPDLDLAYLCEKANNITSQPNWIVIDTDLGRDSFQELAKSIVRNPDFYIHQKIEFIRGKECKEECFQRFISCLHTEITSLEIGDMELDKPGPILLSGPTGSGKSLTAQLMQKPNIITLNLAGITDTLLEGRIRGWKKGAFTGAASASASIFEQADKGVIFFDELQSASLESQTQLLDLINASTDKIQVSKIGEQNKKEHYQVKCVFAVNENIDYLIEKSALRQDLFYRMRQIKHFRPLSERLSDDKKGQELLKILLMVNRWKYANDDTLINKNRNTKEIQIKNILSTEFPESTLVYLQEYSWPGNLREFERVLADIYWDVSKKGLPITVTSEHIQRKHESFIGKGRSSASLKATTSSENTLKYDTLNKDEIYVLNSVQIKLRDNKFNIKKTLEELAPFRINARATLKKYLTKNKHLLDENILEGLEHVRFSFLE